MFEKQILFCFNLLRRKEPSNCTVSTSLLAEEGRQLRAIAALFPSLPSLAGWKLPWQDRRETLSWGTPSFPRQILFLLLQTPE